MLDTLSGEILEVILNSKGFLTAKDIGVKLNLSARMVRYRLKIIDSWLNSQNQSLIIKPGMGINFKAPPIERKRIINELISGGIYQISLLPRERMYNLIICLLTSSHPQVIKQFAYDFKVSRNTIRRDLDHVEKWLDNYNIKLIRKQNFGCIIEGTEPYLREAIVCSLLEGVGEEHLLTSFGGVRGDKILELWRVVYEKKYITSFLEDLALPKIYTIIKNSLMVPLVDRLQLTIIIKLAVIIWRTQHGHNVNVVEPTPVPEDTISESQAVKKVMRDLCQEFGINTKTRDFYYLIKCLIDKDRLRSTNNMEQSLKELTQINPEILAFVDETIEKISSYLHPLLLVDQQLRFNIATHISHYFNANYSYSQPKNPILPEIRKEYPYVFQCVWDSINSSDSYKGLIGEDEIGCLTLYYAAAMERLRPPLGSKMRILIVCESGIASALLLQSRILSEFPDVEVVGVISSLEIEEFRFTHDYDLVISTIYLEIIDKPVIVVNPFLKYDDLVKIKNALAINGDALPKTDVFSLSDILNMETVKLNVKAESWQEVVEKAGAILLAQGTITPGYIQAMKDVIRNQGPYMVIWPGIALLHAHPRHGVLDLSMSLITTTNPVHFGHPENDPVDMAIVLGAIDNESHIPVLFELIELLKDEVTTHSLRNAIHLEQAIQVINNYSGSSIETHLAKWF